MKTDVPNKMKTSISNKKGEKLFFRGHWCFPYTPIYKMDYSNYPGDSPYPWLGGFPDILD